MKARLFPIKYLKYLTNIFCSKKGFKLINSQTCFETGDSKGWEGANIFTTGSGSGLK